ncbi:ParB/RepB/Spo0J family partition protein [Bosea sp. SSUT16]|uniref:ParB/RepB/Spo0J family partition protein n=1 Tax=Bosea spartocytisi TaxID=2773451 RepID=A0A927EAU1_9HYPH|nr:ParB/RepB/Spo0J family partition protein [Bosea spartocytisi]MBD3845971.1 ParB/RepB/Spo0J family partition protein [Bosea spartocytisi]MCT4473155.1 ParB/RepB/Spo0J family partition protein [Bosea spartocytisi]
MTEVIAYRLDQLIAGDAVNVRPQDEEVSELVASIRAHGLLQPLVGRLRGDKVEIVDGNRRLKALQLIDSDDDAADITTIDKVHVVLRLGEDEVDAFEVSLAANVLRKPLHPVREFEAFADLIEKGKPKEEIAAHFGIPLRAVEQRLALGRLHEDVRAAWLEGRITGEAARAFTLVPAEQQAAYLRKAIETDEGWRLRADTVRRSFTAETVEADTPKVRFVGIEAYRAAGGGFVADLFANEPDLTDSALLERLANEKLAAEAARLKQDEGWGEVLFGNEARTYEWNRITKPALPDSEKPARAIEIEARLLAIAEHRDKLDEALLEIEDEDRLDEIERDRDVLLDEEDRLDLELEALIEAQTWLRLTEAQRSKAITTVGYNRDGKLTIARGYTRSKPKAEPKPTAMAAPAPKPSAGGEEAPEPARLSAALVDDLALTATRAAAHVLAGEPRIALAAFVATAVTWGTPLRFDNKGRQQGPSLPWPGRSHQTEERFGKVFRDVLGWDMDALQKGAAKVIAGTLDFTSAALAYHSYDSLKADAVTDLRASLPKEMHRAALVQAFDPADYFSKAPKQESIIAIAECGDDPGKYAKLKKADLGATAARLANARAWLPATLRGEVFDAVLPAEPEAEDQDEQAGEHEASAELETAESAAEAAQRIWQDQERKRLEELKTPDVRAEFAARGIKAPFGKSKNQMIEMLLAQPAETEEAA